MLLVILAQLVAAAGWGWYFPWAVPALVSGMAGPGYSQVPVPGCAIVAVTSLIGIVGSLGWWELADHTR